MARSFTIEGQNIHGIASFYDEINRVFMADEDWNLGPSLDALDDMLYGGYGALVGAGPVLLIWRQMEKNRHDLGREATMAHYRDKLEDPGRFNTDRIQRDIAALLDETGPSYFDIVLQIIADHPGIELRPV
ncbi:ribonuclease inhibitor [Novosphingobium barchaimii LL02]|uniref:Ribonuclease inhibitor n=1 Tax=Novosphingobium barchaimii LL02 TaxID=1114963 RepID=A0A0J8AHA7_9SPHN|nr:barstar family protein [Novosphingobium barchaimii]KMS54215.1 ribonuclease inhibitor [Novosphingobium barchaimii LL02]